MYTAPNRRRLKIVKIIPEIGSNGMMAMAMKMVMIRQQ